MTKRLQLLLVLVFACVAGMSAQAVLEVDETSSTLSQNFDSMWDNNTAEATLALPNGWRIDRQMSAPRTVGPWSTAAQEVMYSGGVSLASNAKNGTWNFGSSSTPGDRAVGGLSTTVDNGTRCVSVMTQVVNRAAVAIENVNVSYDIEKYRLGDNAAGFDVQLYYSSDGVNWINAGDDFKTHFDADATTAGAADVPISTTSVNGKSLRVRVNSGASLYLAWNITVASGSSPNKAPGLSIDNVNLAFTFAGESNTVGIYAEDVTKWKSLLMAIDRGPFVEPAGSANVNGVSYKYFEMPADGATHHVEFSNGAAKTVTAPDITADGDHYLCVTADEVTEITDPENYTGWVDPTRPPFVASGIYLRGEVNSWGAVAEWEFSDEGDGTYVLYDKVLSGSFKVADANWSSACNYGSNGTSAALDMPYQLVLGTNDNITCGGNTYACGRIVLTIADGNATLLLESDSNDDDLDAVYIIGDNNGWNYMDESGKLALTDQEGVFSGQVTMSAPADDEFCHWRLYQRLGMSGVWGNPGGNDATGNNTQGLLEKGSSGTMSTLAGTYQVTFNITTGEFAMELLGSIPTEMTFEPANAVLVPQLPATVKVLSLNNSLIHYNEQDQVFNAIAQAMGKDATWKKHSLLGKSLKAHWDEGDGLAGDGLPGAKMLVRTEAWSHIILQEQSVLPRTDFAAFRENVTRWVNYIREYCPNPNAVIILPVNWALIDDWQNFSAFNQVLIDNYRAVAQELGVTLCPVGVAYERAYEAEGQSALASWFQDERHPTDKSTYLAACMEYQVIFGEDAATINYAPTVVSAADAEKMRTYASQTLATFDNVVNHTAGTVHYKVKVFDQFGMEITPDDPVVLTAEGGTIDANGLFTSNGTEGVFNIGASTGTFNRNATLTVASAVTAYEPLPAVILNAATLAVSEDFDNMGDEATATLPTGWRIDRQTSAPRTVGRFDQADEQTMYSGGTSLASNAKNGTWNLGATSEPTDRSLGGISTGVSGGTRCVNVYTHLLNEGTKTIENVKLSYDIEKYRQGSNSAGFAVQLYYSIDGRNWTSAGNDFRTVFEADATTAGYADAPGEVRNVEATLPVDIEPGVDMFLAWNISVASGTNAASAMVLAVDNVALEGTLPTIPKAKHYIYAEDKTGWDALGLYAWGDSELFGAWPGQAVAGDTIIGGMTYKVFLLDAESGNYHLIFNNWNNGSQLPDYDIVANRDFYFRLENGVAVEVQPVVYSPFDVNHDGEVNVGDVTAVYSAILNGNSSQYAAVADVNGDGNINTGDVSAVYVAILAQ